MKRILIAAALALSACATIPAIPPAPASVANASTLDEQTALAVELAYQAAATAVLATGLATKPAVKAADRKAYAAVKAVRAAYDTGNASSYATAAVTARTALTDLLTAIRS